MTRYRVKFGAALVNSAAQTVAIMSALFLIVIAACFIQGVEISPDEWRMLFMILGGAVVLCTLGLGISSLFNWYAVDESGLSYRVPAGMGEAILIRKKTGKATWQEIIDATPSRLLPYLCINVTIKRSDSGKGPQKEWITLPLYLKEQQAFTRTLINNAPQDHCLLTVLASGNTSTGK